MVLILGRFTFEECHAAPILAKGQQVYAPCVGEQRNVVNNIVKCELNILVVMENREQRGD